MLAQNFMTAKALGISEKEQAALVATLHAIDRGELAHDNPNRPSRPNGFNMSRLHVHTECGTVACLKGWACHFALDDIFPCEYLTEPLLDLFMYERVDIPRSLNWNRAAVTTDQAAHALRNYLTTGAPRWDEILV